TAAPCRPNRWQRKATGRSMHRATGTEELATLQEWLGQYKSGQAPGWFARSSKSLPAAALQLQHRWKTAQGRFPAQIVGYELAGGGGHFHRACLVSDKANRRRY